MSRTFPGRFIALAFASLLFVATVSRATITVHDLSQNTSTGVFTYSVEFDMAADAAAGDGFVIYYCYPALDQVGRGSGDLLVDVGNWPNVSTINAATGTSSWPRQILEPLYSWGNTLNGSVAGITSGYANIQEGRDIYQNAIKPGYTPLIHPHPLVSGSSTINLLPPSGLQAH